jgi:hypothetical protein
MHDSQEAIIVKKIHNINEKGQQLRKGPSMHSCTDGRKLIQWRMYETSPLSPDQTL